jgi:hypothetical protein
MIHIIFKVCFTFENKDTLIKQKLYWLHLLIYLITFCIIKVANIYIIRVIRGSSCAYHIHLVIIFHFYSYFVYCFLKKDLRKHHKGCSRVNYSKNLYLICWVHDDFATIFETSSCCSPIHCWIEFSFEKVKGLKSFFSTNYLGGVETTKDYIGMRILCCIKVS